MRKLVICTLIASCVLLFGVKLICNYAQANEAATLQAPIQTHKKSNHWLLDEANHEARFKKLETYLRGFDQPMWEVGQRYEFMHQALQRNNYDLAAYHWKKIKKTIENGLMKRPARAANAEQILLNTTWKAVNDALLTKQPEQAWKGFQQATAACMACHVAENVAFMNDQPLFAEKLQQVK